MNVTIKVIIATAICTFALQLEACGNNQSGSSLASSADLSALNSSFASYRTLSSSKSFTDAISVIGSTDLNSFYKQALAASNNETHRVGTHAFSHMKDYYSSMSDQVASNAKKFKNPAQLWSSIGFKSNDEISISQYNDGLAVYERISQAIDEGKKPVVTADDSVLLAKVELVTLAETLARPSASLELSGNNIQINNMSGGTINTGDTTSNNQQTVNNNCQSTNVGVANQPQSGCGQGNTNGQRNGNSASASASASATNNGQIAGGAAAGANNNGTNNGNNNGSGNGNGNGQVNGGNGGGNGNGGGSGSGSGSGS